MAELAKLSTKRTSLFAGLNLYIRRQASDPLRYLLEQSLFLLVGWIPTVVGIGVRAVLYRLILRMDGVAAIENGVRIRLADQDTTWPQRLFGPGLLLARLPTRHLHR